MHNKKIRVLVDGVGGDVGQGVVKCLLDSSLDIDLYVSCISQSSSWLHKIEKSFIFPLVQASHYIDYLINFLNSNKIDVYFPTIDGSLLKIAQFREEIESKSNAVVFIDDYEKIKICSDKLLTNNFLINNNFPAPGTITMNRENEVMNFVAQYGFPLILKPRSGNGSKNVFIIENDTDLIKFIGRDDLILQEYLDIETGEITSGIYYGDDTECKGIYAFKRELRNGSTFKAERIINDNLESVLKQIAFKLNMKYLNIQAVYINDKLYPFEFNGRLSGTTGAARVIFNAPEMFIRERVLKELIIPSDHKKKFYFTRYSEEVMYFEDSINTLKERTNLL